jgi:hypothetical protein
MVDQDRATGDSCLDGVQEHGDINQVVESRRGSRSVINSKLGVTAERWFALRVTAHGARQLLEAANRSARR